MIFIIFIEITVKRSPKKIYATKHSNVELASCLENHPIVSAQADYERHEPIGEHGFLCVETEAFEIPLLIEHLGVLVVIEECAGRKIHKERSDKRTIKLHPQSVIGVR